MLNPLKSNFSMRYIPRRCQLVSIRNASQLTYFVDRASHYKFLVITTLTTSSCIYLFHVSTCLEHHGARH